LVHLEQSCLQLLAGIDHFCVGFDNFIARGLATFNPDLDPGSDLLEQSHRVSCGPRLVFAQQILERLDVHLRNQIIGNDMNTMGADFTAMRCGIYPCASHAWVLDEL
jgi:hypothetical protein